MPKPNAYSDFAHLKDNNLLAFVLSLGNDGEQESIEGINVNVRSAFTVAFTFRSAFLALNAAANACERESMRGCARGVR